MKEIGGRMAEIRRIRGAFTLLMVLSLVALAGFIVLMRSAVYLSLGPWRAAVLFAFSLFFALLSYRGADTAMFGAYVIAYFVSNRSRRGSAKRMGRGKRPGASNRISATSAPKLSQTPPLRCCTVPPPSPRTPRSSAWAPANSLEPLCGFARPRLSHLSFSSSLLSPRFRRFSEASLPSEPTSPCERTTVARMRPTMPSPGR